MRIAPEGALDDARLFDLLSRAQNIAVVGASSNPTRPSYDVSQYLLAQGYAVMPVNPAEAIVLGQQAYPSLHALPRPPDIVVLFRRSEQTLSHAPEAAQAGAVLLWLQLGVSYAPTAALADELGLRVVMDRCIKLEHQRLGIARKSDPSETGEAASPR